MDTSRAARYEGLLELNVAGLHAFCSPGTITPALRLAGRCATAQRVLARLFGFPIFPELLILSRADWPDRAALPTYGVTHYDLPRRAIVAPGEPADFWTPVLELLERAAPEQLPRLRAVYGDSAGRPDLTAHVDKGVAHDLGHAYHLDRGGVVPAPLADGALRRPVRLHRTRSGRTRRAPRPAHAAAGALCGCT